MLGDDIFAEPRLLITDDAADNRARHSADCRPDRAADNCATYSTGRSTRSRATLSIRLGEYASG
jgi:hypothetical protein